MDKTTDLVKVDAKPKKTGFFSKLSKLSLFKSKNNEEEKELET